MTFRVKVRYLCCSGIVSEKMAHVQLTTFVVNVKTEHFEYLDLSNNKGGVFFPFKLGV